MYTGRFLPLLAALLAVSFVADVDASTGHHARAGHHKAVRRGTAAAHKRSKGSCANNNNSNNNNGASSSSVAYSAANWAASAVSSSSSSSASPKPTGSNGNAGSIVSSLGSSVSSSVKGLFGVSSPQCGSSGAMNKTTTTAGPNGSEKFLTCGLSSQNKNSPWTPPKVTLDQLQYTDLDTALAKPNSIFSPCKPYVQYFKKYGQLYNIPPILLASFAMQESTCNPNTTGDDGGAFGLMQITKDKCGGAPGGNCADPNFNVNKGAQYFAGLLKQYGGDFLQAAGAYNGWYKGMTYNDAIKIKSQCCACQQNLDYVFQLVSGWMLGVDVYSQNMGSFQNLKDCGN